MGFHPNFGLETGFQGMFLYYLADFFLQQDCIAEPQKPVSARKVIVFFAQQCGFF